MKALNIIYKTLILILLLTISITGIVYVCIQKNVEYPSSQMRKKLKNYLEKEGFKCAKDGECVIDENGIETTIYLDSWEFYINDTDEGNQYIRIIKYALMDDTLTYSESTEYSLKEAMYNYKISNYECYYKIGNEESDCGFYNVNPNITADNDFSKILWYKYHFLSYLNDAGIDIMQFR